MFRHFSSTRLEDRDHLGVPLVQRHANQNSKLALGRRHLDFHRNSVTSRCTAAGICLRDGGKDPPHGTKKKKRKKLNSSGRLHSICVRAVKGSSLRRQGDASGTAVKVQSHVREHARTLCIHALCCLEKKANLQRCRGSVLRYRKTRDESAICARNSKKVPESNEALREYRRLKTQSASPTRKRGQNSECSYSNGYVPCEELGSVYTTTFQVKTLRFGKASPLHGNVLKTMWLACQDTAWHAVDAFFFLKKPHTRVQRTIC